MKTRKAILRIESENGKEEYCFNVNSKTWKEIISSLTEEEAAENNNVLKNIIKESVDKELVYYTLCALKADVPYEDLESVLCRFENDADMQTALIWYCGYKERYRHFIVRMSEKGATSEVKKTAKEWL